MNVSDYLTPFKSTTLHIVGPFYAGNDFLSDPLIFVDRGVHYKKSEQGFSVGDGDSSGLQLDQTLNPNKDFSDLAYVLKSIPENFKIIHLHGFLGGRKDHELMNLAEVHCFLKNRPFATQVYFDTNIVASSRGEWSFEIKGTFSLFAFEDGVISLSGDCEYPITKEKPFKALSSHGLSNQGHGKIEIICNTPVFVFVNLNSAIAAQPS